MKDITQRQRQRYHTLARLTLEFLELQAEHAAALATMATQERDLRMRIHQLAQSVRDEQRRGDTKTR